ncbi:MAG: YihY/virulence factor BrkB family protein [Oscillospiraceae bacterium]|jgi:membrane protein|nr:YihY/virulence factor BrkB family protein [Oscillospiraceae bacterium]
MTKRRLAEGLMRYIRHIRRDDSFGVAAKTAFFFLLSLFPLMMLAGWALSRTGNGFRAMAGFLPPDLLRAFEGVTGPRRITPIVLLGTVWAASSGVWALMCGVRQAYIGRVDESFWKFLRARVMAAVFTVGFLAVLALSLTASFLVLSAAPVIFLTLFALYTLTPGSPKRPKRTAFSAALATVLWLLLSRGFGVYMRVIARYDALYGAIGVFVGLAFWVFLICAVVILGAELAAL